MGASPLLGQGLVSSYPVLCTIPDPKRWSEIDKRFKRNTKTRSSELDVPVSGRIYR